MPVMRRSSDYRDPPCKAWGPNYLKPCVPTWSHTFAGIPRCIYCKGFVNDAR